MINKKGKKFSHGITGIASADDFCKCRAIGFFLCLEG